MSYNLLFEMAAAIGTQRMVELCEHYLWVTDTLRSDAFDPSGAIIPPAWRDRGSRWEDAPATPPRPPPPAWPVCPGAPLRASPSVARADFNSPAMRPLDLSGAAPLAETLSELASPALGLTTLPIVRAELGRQALEALESGNYGGKTRQQLLEALRDYDPSHPLLCSLHESRVPGGPALGYSRNSSGNYATFAPGCIGCSVGLAEMAAPAEEPEPEGEGELPAEPERPRQSWGYRPSRFDLAARRTMREDAQNRVGVFEALMRQHTGEKR